MYPVADAKSACGCENRFILADNLPESGFCRNVLCSPGLYPSSQQD
jgi:hypothetical protein